MLALGMIYFILISLLARSSSTYNPTMQGTIMLFMLSLTATNSLAAATVSEILLITNQTLIFGKLPGSSGNLYIISPWILHIGLYLVLTVLMFVTSIAFVKRPDR